MAADALLETPLHAWHVAHGGRMVAFAGWSMPVQYSGIIDEHNAVRRGVGLFDISHMGRLRFEGPGAADWLERTTTNQVERLAPGGIQYSLIANERGGVVDDVLVYRRPNGGYTLVCNASNRAKVTAHLESQREGHDAALIDETTTRAMIAVQGPSALGLLRRLTQAPIQTLKYYHAIDAEVAGVPALVSRTGYTGEDGFELIVAAPAAVSTWDALMRAGESLGVHPCGLGARDTLRFEAAMALYGHELGDEINPYEAGVGWAVKLGKEPFVGRDALIRLREAPGRARIGLELAGKRIARQGAAVLGAEGREIGAVTSGTFAPTLGRSLAMALVEAPAPGVGSELTVDVRGHREPARVVPLPFYRRAGA
jgi:aminomethyltransferase